MKLVSRTKGLRILANRLVIPLWIFCITCNVEPKIEYLEECANFRAGDIRLKAQNDTDVSAVFAAVCVHGFAYRIIGKI